MSQKAPKCALHIGVEMTPRESRRPSFVFDIETDQDGKPSSGQRKFWKCPVAGCVRVAVYESTSEELQAARDEVLCPTCGKKSDAPGEYRAIGRNRCVSCSTKAAYASNARAKQRRQTQRAA